MKITKLETFSNAYVGFVRVTTDSGAQGWGQLSPYHADITATVFHRQNAPWSLAAGAADLDGDLLPELYFANDFGPDRLLHNRSTPGRVTLVEVRGRREPALPRSRVVGRDSFKGMGVDFGDLNGDGRLDIAVSNIATPYGLLESHFAFLSMGENAGYAGAFGQGFAPYRDASEPLGLARGGWAWESRLGDFDGVVAKDRKKLAGSLGVGGRLQPTELRPSKLKNLDDPAALAREAFTQLDDGPEVFELGLALLSVATEQKIPADEVKGLVDRITRLAAAYGSRWERDVVLKLSTTLAGQDAFADLALAQARADAGRLLQAFPPDICPAACAIEATMFW